ncbi:sel1 repeat family protein [Burkholderiales bacterium]|nr:sel1 repeat family protein [Burkholderiales bacterium]
MHKLLLTLFLIVHVGLVQADDLADERTDCDGGGGLACFRLAILYNNGVGVEKNLSIALELFKKSCEGDEAVGCAYAGNAYKIGRGVGKSNSRALYFYRLSCDLKLQMACDEYLKLEQ